MPKKNTSGLTDIKVKNAKPGDKAYKLFDKDGLFLFVSPSGGKLWRLKYRFDGKEKVLSFGKYPVVSLLDARGKLLDAKKFLDKGIDPGAIKKAKDAEKTERKENTFENIAREWFVKFSTQWTASTAQKKIRRLETIVFPAIGSMPVKEIKAPDVLAILRTTEERGAIDLAHRLKIACSQVFRYAIATGKAERDPTADLRGALHPINVTHRAAIIEPEKAAELLRAIDRYNGTFVVRCALRLSPLFFVRPGELRKAEWADVNFEAGLWSLPDIQMKMKTPHIVPLATQALEILKELHTVTGSGKYVFPANGKPDKHMSENTINQALRRMGYSSEDMTGHGFRAMARTILDEVLQIRPDFIEHQLAHAVRDPLGRAYNRTSHLEERRKMMQKWADYLDNIKSEKNISSKAI